MEYTVSHQRGIAGVDEREVERVQVEAQNEAEAVEKASGWPDGRNPESTQGGSGRYNDYWMVEESESDSLRRQAADHFEREIPAGAVVIEPDREPWNRISDAEWQRQDGIRDGRGVRILALDCDYVILRDAEVEAELRELALQPTADEIPEDELVANFRLLYGRDPDATDREQGLWSLICAGLEREA